MFDIENWVYRTFDDVKQNDKNYSVACPFCEDVKHHLSIAINKPVCHCFRCGYKANWIGLVMGVTGFPFHRAFGELYVQPNVRDFSGILFQGEENEEEKESEYRFPKDFENLCDAMGLFPRKAKEYLLLRGFGDDHWRSYNIGVAASLYGRVVIPIEKGYWQARRIFKAMEPKYINPSNPARDVIFNSQALHKFDEVVVCEGAFSAMAVGENAVALIGKEPTEEKLSRLIGSSAETFIIALEPGAYPTMSKLCHELHVNGKTVLLWRYLTGDPADPNGKFVEMEYSFKNRIALKLENS